MWFVLRFGRYIKMNGAISLPVVIVYSTIMSCMSYSYGPPATEHVCREMFPEGHHVDSQRREPPYEIDLSQNTYTPWDDLDVSVKVTKPDEYFRGFFLQVRRANCSHPYQHEPLGTFTVNQVDSSLIKTLSCLNNIRSAVSHKTNMSLSKAVIKWNAPAAMIGHMYFVATIVKEQDIFWTDVRSQFVTQSGKDDQSYEYCPMRKLIDPPHVNTTPKPDVPTPEPGKGTTTERNAASHRVSIAYLIIVCISLLFV